MKHISFDLILIITCNLLVIIFLHFIAISNAKIEKGASYGGFWKDVFYELFKTGGQSHILNPLPILPKKSNSREVNDILKKRYWYVVAFWLSFILFILLSYYSSNKK